MSLFDTGIRPHIDAHLLAKSKEVRDYQNYWSASSAGMCQRLVIMRRLGVPPVPEIEEGKARLQRVFQSGHLFHEFFQRITKDAGLSIAQELELQDESLMVRGHIDDLVLINTGQLILDSGEVINPKLKPGGVVHHKGNTPRPVQHLILYDYKSQNSKAFNYKRDEMSHTHRMQLGTYMYMLRKLQKSGMGWMPLGVDPKIGIEALHNLTEARILYFDKDTMRQDEKQLMWDTQLESDVLSYWTKLNDHWEKKTLPKCTCLEHDGGYMARRTKDGRIFNDYFYEDEPCSLKWYKLWKERKDDNK